MPDRHQRSPTGVHSNADRRSLHHRRLSGPPLHRMCISIRQMRK
jgi:hypothetical protein